MNVNESNGHRWAVVDTGPELEGDGWLAVQEIELSNPDKWDRYDNPFERKFTWNKDRNPLPAAVERVMQYLEGPLREQASRAFGLQLMRDERRHYGGVFRYAPGDWLDVHVDAGIHPATGLRKRLTCVLYLGLCIAGPLELWSGDNAAEGDTLRECFARIWPLHARAVLFENTDYAWHGTPVLDSERERLVVTVSYLDEGVEAFDNRRQRAFFAPRPDEVWDDERRALRDLRADAERYGEAYKVPSRERELAGVS